jgi:hypothetical protein
VAHLLGTLTHLSLHLAATSHALEIWILDVGEVPVPAEATKCQSTSRPLS